MSVFLEKIFGPSKAPLHRDLDTHDEKSTSVEARRIEVLVNKAQKFYPHKDPSKALALFREAISLVGPAPASKTAQENRDLTSIGDAFWMAWVCLDLLDQPEEETEALLAEARKKSPATAERIEAQISEVKEKTECGQQLAEAIEMLKHSKDHTPSQIQEAISALDKDGAWWDLRDAGIAVTKAGEYDLALKILNSALKTAMAKSGNVPSIYVAMGDLRKTQQLYQEAARCYLLSCLSGQPDPLKRAVDQLRISLKKANVAGDPPCIGPPILFCSSESPNFLLINML